MRVSRRRSKASRCSRQKSARWKSAGSLEAVLGRRQPQHVGDAVGARDRAIGLVGGSGDEVPGAVLEDQAVRRQAALHLARRLPAAVGDVDDAVVEDGGGEVDEVRRLLGRVVPRRGVQAEPVAEPAGPDPLLGSERREQLALGRGRLGAETQVGGRPGQADDEEGEGLVLGQAGEAGAVAVDEAVAAGAALLGVHRDAGRRERLDVAVDGAQRDLELGRPARERSRSGGPGAASGWRRAGWSACPGR